MYIVSIKQLKPLEKVFPTHLKNLESMIDTFVYKSIIADGVTGTILDGSHRYAYFLKHGYQTVPVKFVDYSDENIRVGTRLSERFFVESPTISKQQCIDRALSGNLFPPRTTRHFFTFRKDDEPVELKDLEKGEPQDISHLLADVDVSDEINSNTEYIKEIDEEVDVILDYLQEIKQTKKYLTEQIDQMKQPALFVGKFNPPHIGHCKTILNLSKYYDLTVGISEDVPENATMTPDEVESEIAGLGVKTQRIKGRLIDDTNPNYGLILSGNPEVIDWAKKYNVPHKFVPRSGKVSGTQIRNGKSS